MGLQQRWVTCLIFVFEFYEFGTEKEIYKREMFKFCYYKKIRVNLIGNF